MRTITLQGVAGEPNRREGPLKRLSDVEFQARHEKGLCFRCEERFFVGHKCKVKDHKELRVLVVGKNREELEVVEEEYSKTEIQETEVVKQELVIKLSINSVVRLTNPGTMKIKGMIRERSVVVLIDCDATHNFISENLVTQLLLSLEETSHYGVISGSESAVKGKGICKQVELLLSEWKVVDNFLPLELGGVDVILGMQWLHT